MPVNVNDFSPTRVGAVGHHRTLEDLRDDGRSDAQTAGHFRTGQTPVQELLYGEGPLVGQAGNRRQVALHAHRRLAGTGPRVLRLH